jgi:hypothetical protein
MIALFTDFGLHGPYTGQMKAHRALDASAPRFVPAIQCYKLAPDEQGCESKMMFRQRNRQVVAVRTRRFLGDAAASRNRLSSASKN